MARLLKVTGDGKGIDAQEVRRALTLLADPRHAIQLQYAHFHRESFQTFAGTKEGLDKAAQWVGEHAGAKGIYFALNPLPVGFAKQVTCEAILYRRWMLVDIDRYKTKEVVGKDSNGQPVLNEHLSATDEEHEAARSLMYDVLEYLDGLGWPAPLIVDSGNGFHLLYPIELPNDKLSMVNVKFTLDKLEARFNDERGTIGAECFDARRISALPGTWKRRGPVWKDRPYRMVKLIGGPDV